MIEPNEPAQTNLPPILQVARIHQRSLERQARHEQTYRQGAHAGGLFGIGGIVNLTTAELTYRLRETESDRSAP